VPSTPKPLTRLRRIAVVARFLFFAALPSLPFIVYIERDNRLVVILCFSACVIAGLILKSKPVLFTLLGALVGFFIADIAEAGRRHRDHVGGLLAVFFFAGFGLVIGIIAQLADGRQAPDK
jgi:hypothetical protein